MLQRWPLIEAALMAACSQAVPATLFKKACREKVTGRGRDGEKERERGEGEREKERDKEREREGVSVLPGSALAVAGPSCVVICPCREARGDCCGCCLCRRGAMSPFYVAH